VAEAPPWSSGAWAGLESETPAETEYTVVELLALLVRHQFVRELVLEGGEVAECGAAALGDGDPHGEDVLASEAAAVKLEVRARALFTSSIEHVIGAQTVGRGHAVDVGAQARDVVAAVAVELEGPLGAGVGGNFREGFPYYRGVHSLLIPSVGRPPGGPNSAAAFLFTPLF
jgi:hypothetical protein